ncbi:MAG: Hsp70 family protein [Lewinellaceae bacterium]|nr:Hsp70 family protein [Lewinellaceae bacterium]
MGNELTKYQGEIIRRVEIAINITNKLIKANPNQALQLYDPLKNKYNDIAKEELIEFIKVNFWYFLSAIFRKERTKYYYTTTEISKEILDRIRSTKHKFEFPRCSYKDRIEGEAFDRMKDTKPYEISMKLDEAFKQSLLDLICPTIAGKILSHFADTSIGHILFSEINHSLEDVIPLSLYYALPNGLAELILKVNTPIPVQTTINFKTSEDWQTNIKVHLLQGFSTVAKENKSLIKFTIDNVPPQLRGSQQIEVILTIDINGILHLDSLDRNIKIFIDKKFDGLSKEQIRELREKCLGKSVMT